MSQNMHSWVSKEQCDMQDQKKMTKMLCLLPVSVVINQHKVVSETNTQQLSYIFCTVVAWNFVAPGAHIALLHPLRHSICYHLVVYELSIKWHETSKDWVLQRTTLYAPTVLTILQSHSIMPTMSSAAYVIASFGTLNPKCLPSRLGCMLLLPCLPALF